MQRVRCSSQIHALANSDGATSITPLYSSLHCLLCFVRAIKICVEASYSPAHVSTIFKYWLMSIHDEEAFTGAVGKCLFVHRRTALGFETNFRFEGSDNNLFILRLTVFKNHL